MTRSGDKTDSLVDTRPGRKHEAQKMAFGWVISKLSERLSRYAIRRALSKLAPDRIPLAGDSVTSRDYFTVYLMDVDNFPRFYAKYSLGKGVEGIWFNDGVAEGSPASIPFFTLHSFHPRFTHYAHELEIRFSSAFEFIIQEFLSVDWLKVRLERIQTFLFNRRKLVRTDRIKLLSHIVDGTTRRHEYRVSSFGVMSEFYGRRWALHPDNDQIRSWYELLLDSLVESGDLKKNSINYSLTPRALCTLSIFEQESAKHRNEIRVQSILAILTAALVVIGAFQVMDKIPSVNFEIRVGLSP